MALIQTPDGWVSPAGALPPYVLALDVGSSSVRAVLFDGRGRPVRGVSARRPYRLRTAADGTAEADATQIFALITDCLDEVHARAGQAGIRPAAVASCTLVSNVLGVDASGRPLTPVYTYADTRPAAEVRFLRQHLDEREVHRRTGCRFHTSYLPARFLWLRRRQPDLFHRVWRWMSLGEYVEFQLFGEAAVTYSVASWTGLLDRHRLRWDADLLAFLDLPVERLSPLTDVSHPRQGLRSPYAARWPLLQDIPWFPAVGDGAAANVGSGCVTPDRIALTLGTTSAMRAVVPGDVPDVPWGLWCYRVDGHRSLPGGALSEGGNVFAWLRDTLRLSADPALDEALAAMPPDGHGLTVLPFFAGERSPGWHEDARATIHGLTLAHTPQDILRAGMEAVAYRLAAVLERLQTVLPPVTHIIAGGGALQHSRAWRQILADVLARPLAVTAIPETSARGAALLALEALHALPDLTHAPVYIREVHEPNEAHHARYQDARARQERLYRLLVATEEDAMP